MHDLPALRRAAWTQRLLTCMDGLAGASSGLDASYLSEALASIASWDGCPHAQDVFRGEAFSYRRIPLTRRDAQAYEALLIAWPPGHATPIHDHGGLWGLVFVLDGALDEEAFAVSADDGLRLDYRGAMTAQPGDCLCVTDADYAHRCRNPSPAYPALSLHLYGGWLDGYRRFDEEAGRWTATAQQSVREHE